MKFIPLIIISLILLSTNVYAFFQPDPVIKTIIPECVYADNNVIIMNVLNEYSPVGHSTGKTIVSINSNSEILEIVTLFKGDIPDFDNINLSGNKAVLIDNDLLQSGYSDTAFIFLGNYTGNITLEINATMFYTGRVSTVSSIEIPVCKSSGNYSLFAGKSSKFLAQWLDSWDMLSGKKMWESQTSLSLLESLVSLSGTSWELAKVSDPGWIDNGMAMNDIIMKRVPVIGSFTNMMFTSADRLISSLIISINSWTFQTEKILNDVSELELLFLNESHEWGNDPVDYEKLSQILSEMTSKINEIYLDQEEKYYENLGYHHLSGMLRVLEEFLESASDSIHIRIEEVSSQANSGKFFYTSVQVNPIIKENNLTQLIVSLKNIGTEDIVIGTERWFSTTRSWGHTDHHRRNTSTETNFSVLNKNLTIYNQWKYISGIARYDSRYYYRNLYRGRWDYTYFIAPNSVVYFMINIDPPLSLEENENATLIIRTQNTTDIINFSLHTTLSQEQINYFLGLGINLPYCQNKERNIRIKLKKSNYPIFEYNKRMGNIFLNLSPGIMELSIFPDFYLRNKFSVNFTNSENISVRGFIPGNMDNDDKISIKDLDEIKKSFADIINENHDINCDGNTDILDMIIIGKNIYQESAEMSQDNFSIKMVKLKGNDKLDEGVLLQGYGNITGFTLQDSANHVYTFPHFLLNNTVFVHTGYGHNNAADLYWNRGSAVWNNPPAGDAAILLSPQGIIIDRQECYQNECWY